MARSPQGAFYVDALAGYAYSNNQLQRQILIPGLQQRHGQRLDRRQPVPRPGRGRLQVRRLCAGHGDAHAVRALADLQRRRRTPSANGARQSLSLNVAQQTTTSLRTTSAPTSRARSGSATSAGSALRFAGLAARISPTPAGRSPRPSPARRRNGFTVYRRHAAARQRRDRLLGQHHARRGNAALPALRRRSSAAAPTTMR